MATVYDLIAKLATYPADTNIVLAFNWGEPVIDEEYLVLKDPYEPCLVITTPQAAHPLTQGASVDSSISHDPFAPEPNQMAEAQEQSAQELAPPNQGEGQGPGEVNAEVFPDVIVPSGEPQAEVPADPAAEAAPATAPEAIEPEGDAPDAPAVPVGTEPQGEPEAVEVPGVVETMEGQPGEAVNAETGEVTQPGEPLPPIPPEASPADATPTEGTVQ